VNPVPPDAWTLTPFLSMDDVAVLLAMFERGLTAVAAGSRHCPQDWV
jgi:hypothetical protein